MSEPPSSNACVASDASNLTANGSPTSPAIVVAMRDPTLGRMISMALRLEGYTPYHCADGEEAMELLLRIPCAAAVLDARLHKMDGIAICKQVRATEAVATLPVVLVMMRDEPTLLLQGRRMGANAVIFLPFDVEELLTTVAAVLTFSSREARDDSADPE